MLRPATTHPATTPADATITALSNDDGALPNRALHAAVAAPGRHRKDTRRWFGPIIVVQPAVGRWKCDTCRRRGDGGRNLLRHAGERGHLVFSPL